MGKIYKYKTVEFWPERGRIMVIDTEKAAEAKDELWTYITSVDPVEFYKRAIAIYVMCEDTPLDRQQASRLLEDAREACITALRQDENRPKLLEMRKRAMMAWRQERENERRQLILPPGAEVTQQWTFKKESPKKILVSGYEIIPKEPPPKNEPAQ